MIRVIAVLVAALVGISTFALSQTLVMFKGPVSRQGLSYVPEFHGPLGPEDPVQSVHQMGLEDTVYDGFDVCSRASNEYGTPLTFTLVSGAIPKSGGGNMTLVGGCVFGDDQTPTDASTYAVTFRACSVTRCAQQTYQFVVASAGGGDTQAPGQVTLQAVAVGPTPTTQLVLSGAYPSDVDFEDVTVRVATSAAQLYTTGSNKLLLTFESLRDFGGGTVLATGMTHNGDALTSVSGATIINSAADHDPGIQTWYRVNPDAASAALVPSGQTFGDQYYGALILSNVDQMSPIVDSDETVIDQTNNLPISLTLTGEADGLIVCAVNADTPGINWSAEAGDEALDSANVAPDTGIFYRRTSAGNNTMTLRGHLTSVKSHAMVCVTLSAAASAIEVLGPSFNSDIPSTVNLTGTGTYTETADTTLPFTQSGLSAGNTRFMIARAEDTTGNLGPWPWSPASGTTEDSGTGTSDDSGPADNSIHFVEGFEQELSHWGEQHGGAFLANGLIHDPLPPYNRVDEYGIAELETTVVRAGDRAIRFTYDPLVLAYPPDVAHNQAKAGSQPCQYNDGGTPTPCTFGFSLCLPDDNWLTEGWDERATLFFQLHDTGATSQVPISTVLFNISTATAPGRFGFHFRWYRSDGVQGSASHYKTFAEWETYLGHSLFSNWIDIVVSGALDVIPPSSTSVRVWVNADAYTDTPVWQVNNAYWGAYYPQASRPSWGKHPFTKIGTYYWWTKQAGATYGIGDVSGLPVTGRTAVWDSWREVRESAETGFAKVKPPGERPDTCQ